jgi:hypothetical protein
MVNRLAKGPAAQGHHRIGPQHRHLRMEGGHRSHLGQGQLAGQGRGQDARTGMGLVLRRGDHHKWDT